MEDAGHGSAPINRNGHPLGINTSPEGPRAYTGHKSQVPRRRKMKTCFQSQVSWEEMQLDQAGAGRGAVYATAAPSAGNGRKLRVRSGWRVHGKNGDRVCDPPRCPAPSGRSSRPRARRGRPGPGHAHHHARAAAPPRGTLETKPSVSSAGHRRHVRMYSFASLVRAPSTQFILQDQPRT